MSNLLKTAKTERVLFLEIVFVLLAFATMTILSYIFMGSIVQSNLARNADSVLGAGEARILSRRQDFEVSMSVFAEEMQAMALRGENEEALGEYLSDISRFTFLDGSATSGIQSFFGYFQTLPERPDLYDLAVAAKGKIAETVPHITDTGEVLYTYVRSILDENGRVLGIVGMDVKIDVLGQSIVNLASEENGYGILMNQELMVLYHPQEDFKGLYVDNPIIPFSVFADTFHNKDEVTEGAMISYKGEESIAFFRALPNGWYLGMVTPERQYYASRHNMAIALIALGGILAIALSVILIRLDQARMKSDDENQKKSMFLANMSHEIRTPINAIVGMTAIGRAAGTTERKDYCFGKIDSASKHLLGVVNDILDISKIEANKIELSPTDFNFEKMLQQAVSVANFRAEEKRQKLMVHIDKNIPRVLYTDDQRFAQVITNLLSNAIKFTPEEGTIKLNADLIGEEGGVYTIKIAVTDTGIGISPEQQAKLFTPFQQAESSTTRKYGGTGLGLAISKSIVELMGGKIWIESEIGQGTTMSFTAKAKIGDDTRFDLSRQGVNWDNVRILIVDDDADILQYFQEIVSGFSAKSDIAQNAKEALRLIEENGAYNIYFVDLRMPDVDGLELTKKIRSQEKNPGNSIVIMISSADLGAAEQDAKKAGVNRFLLKPLFPSAIADVISECIGLVNDKIEDTPPDINGIFEGHHILFAEDADINREIMLTLLEPTRLNIDCAKNGAEAVRMFNASPEKYEMIFMDIQMPEMDGFEATRRIRAMDLPKAKSIPIVAMTANVFKEDIDNCLAAGMNGHLGKPLDMDNVFSALRKYLMQ